MQNDNIKSKLKYEEAEKFIEVSKERNQKYLKQFHGVTYKNECIKRENKRYRDIIIDSAMKKNKEKNVKSKGM